MITLVIEILLIRVLLAYLPIMPPPTTLITMLGEKPARCSSVAGSETLRAKFNAPRVSDCIGWTGRLRWRRFASVGGAERCIVSRRVINVL